MSSLTHALTAPHRFPLSIAAVMVFLIGALGLTTTHDVDSSTTGDRLVMAALEHHRSLGFAGNAVGTSSVLLTRALMWEQTTTVSAGEDHLGAQTMPFKLVAVTVDAAGAELHAGSIRLYR